MVASLNRETFRFDGLEPVLDELVEFSQLQQAMLFELAVARAEELLAGNIEANWEVCVQTAARRQSRHYDAKVPSQVTANDFDIAEHAAQNLVAMLNRVVEQHPDSQLEVGPVVPGLGWVASGVGDFSLGSILIEVKHTDRNFVSGDFRQILMYWVLKYIAAIEGDSDVWTDCLLLNPRRNSALLVNYNKLLHAASASSNYVEICELLRSIVTRDQEWR